MGDNFILFAMYLPLIGDERNKLRSVKGACFKLHNNPKLRCCALHFPLSPATRTCNFWCIYRGQMGGG